MTCVLAEMYFLPFRYHFSESVVFIIYGSGIRIDQFYPVSLQIVFHADGWSIFRGSAFYLSRRIIGIYDGFSVMFAYDRLSCAVDRSLSRLSRGSYDCRSPVICCGDRALWSDYRNRPFEVIVRICFSPSNCISCEKRFGFAEYGTIGIILCNY